ncbi:MAG: class I SAM-dependent methyltransferase [DPANN group archaeon]|nr:class I SAM-dependent methyltransferase [DPANN group archaeon]
MKQEKPETQVVRKAYDRIAGSYDLFEWPVEKLFFNRWRRELFAGLEGNILEIGVGTGKNMPYYPANANVTAIDLSRGMLSKAHKRKEASGYAVDLREMDAEDLRFPAKSFDHVVATFVLCSVPDPVQALKEMKRVVRHRGTIILLEHVLSDRVFLSAIQRFHNPFTRHLFGFNIDRDTKSNIGKAGLSIMADVHLGFYDVFRRFTSHP